MRVPTAIHPEDHAPPAFLIPIIDLDVDIHEDHARVRAAIGNS